MESTSSWMRFKLEVVALATCGKSNLWTCTSFSQKSCTYTCTYVTYICMGAVDKVVSSTYIIQVLKWEKLIKKMLFVWLYTHRAHEAWNLPTPPDFVTFAKKMQLGGFFYRSSARPKEVKLEHKEPCCHYCTFSPSVARSRSMASR